jgi:hypothetical protein
LASGGVVVDDDSSTGEPLSGCGVEDTTVTVSAVNKYTQVATGGTHNYKVNGGIVKTVTDAGTFTASPGDSIEVLFFNGTTGTYFAEKETTVLDCKGTVELTSELSQNGTITIEAFNEEGNLIDGVGENETLANGDVVTLSANLKGQYQRAFPHGGVLVVEFNGTGASSTFDDVIADFGGQEVSVPSIYAITLGSESRTKAFSIPVIESNQILSGSIVLDADDTNNPNDSGDPVLTLYANNYFVNEDNRASFDGPAVADEDDASTYNHVTTFTVHVD